MFVLYWNWLRQRLVGSTKTNNSAWELKRGKQKQTTCAWIHEVSRTGSLRPRRSDFSQIDESVLCIISAVFVAVEIFATAKKMQDFNAIKNPASRQVYKMA